MTSQQKKQAVETIKALIGENMIKQAADGLIQLDQTEKAGIEAEARNCQAEFNLVQSEYDNGVMSREIYFNNLSRLRISLFKMLDKINNLDEQTPENNPILDNNDNPFNDKPNVKFVLLYDPQDAASANQLNKHLTILRLTGKIDVFAVHQSTADEEINIMAEKAIDRAHYVLALISPNIFNNEAFWLGMMLQALEKGKKLIPIRLERTDLEGTGIEGVRGLPALGKTVSEYSNRELAFSEMVDEIKRLLAKN